MAGSEVLAQSGFAERIGRPARVAVINPIPDFSTMLKLLGEKVAVVDLKSEWFTLSYADVWMIFLAEPGEYRLLPEMVKQVFGDKIGDDYPSEYWGATVLQTNDEYRHIGIYFVNNSSLSLKGDACAAAALLIGQIAGFDKYETLSLANECL